MYEILRTAEGGVRGMRITLRHHRYYGPEWAAKIRGRDPKYGLAREFARVVARRWNSAGTTGTTLVELAFGEGELPCLISTRSVGERSSNARTAECFTRIEADGTLTPLDPAEARDWIVAREEVARG